MKNALLVCLLVFTACTIQKRTVNKGYFVQWHGQKHKSVPVTSDIEPGVNRQPAANFDETVIPEEIAQEIAGIEPELPFPTTADAADLQDEAPFFKGKKENTIRTRLPEEKQSIKKTGKLLKRNLVDDIALLYVAIAVGLILLSLLFLVIALNVTAVADIVFFILCICCFLGAIILLGFALLLALFSNNIKSGRRSKR